MKNQPILSLPYSPAERRLQIAAWSLVALHFLLAGFYYPLLPETIPVHFNAGGHIDRRSDKTAIFHLPVIALILCSALALLARFPHTFQYRQPITPENAATEYRHSRRILWVVNVLDGVLFLLLTAGTIWASHSGSLTVTVWMLVVVLVISPWLLFSTMKRREGVVS